MPSLIRSAARLAAAACLLAFAAPSFATADDLRTVAGMTGHNRVLLVFAPALSDPRLVQQRRIFAHFAAEAANRDLLLIQVADGSVIGAHDTSEKLRHRFSIDQAAYKTLLIGKDGHVALEQPGTIDEATLKKVIDAMPMRIDEMRRAGSR